MDATARRYRGRLDDGDLNVSNKTLPGLIILCLGVVVIIIGIILFAAFGIPRDVAGNPRQVSGPIVLALGILISILGMVYAAHLKKPKKRTVTPDNQQGQGGQPRADQLMAQMDHKHRQQYGAHTQHYHNKMSQVDT